MTQASKVTIQREPRPVGGIASAAPSVTGAVGITERGPIGVPVLCTSPADYRRVFGGPTVNSSLALGVAGFFGNGGGLLWVVRTVRYTDITDPASVTTATASVTLTSVDDTDNVFTVSGKTPGAYADRLQVVTTVTGTEFDLAVVEDGVYRERWRSLSVDPSARRYAPNIINNAQNGSVYIQLTDLGVAGAPLVRDQVRDLVGGDDGLTGLSDADFVGSQAGQTGLYALDQVQDLALLMVPGQATPIVHEAMLTYCEQQRAFMTFAVLDAPAGLGATEVVEYVRATSALENRSQMGAIYWPQVRIPNPSRAVFGISDTIVAPPSGHICGMFARTDASGPAGIFQSPAGPRKGVLKGVLGFDSDETLLEDRRDIVYPRRVNPLTTKPGQPLYCDGGRTLSDRGDFAHVGQSRGAVFISRSLYDSLDFVRHENITERLIDQVTQSVTTFLRIQLRANAFATQKEEDAFRVEARGEGVRLIVIASVALSEPAEFIDLRIAKLTADAS